MSDEKRAEINIAIGKKLGFKEFNPGKKSGSSIQWIYPHSWERAKGGQSTTVLPDFLKMIDERFYQIIEVNGGVPSDFNTDLNP